MNAGAKRAIPLAVSGPFHTDYMRSAGAVLREVFDKTQFDNMNMPVVFNAIFAFIFPAICYNRIDFYVGGGFADA